MFPTSAVISAGMHNIKSPPESPKRSITTTRSMKDLLRLSRQAPSRPLTPPKPEPLTPTQPVSQHPVLPPEATPDSQRTIIHLRLTPKSPPVSPTAHRGSVQRLNLARAIQVNNPGDNFSYMSSQSSRDSYPSTAVPPSPSRRVASSIYSRTASGQFTLLDNEMALAADAAAARTFLFQQDATSAAPSALVSRTDMHMSPDGQGREGEGGLSPFPCTNLDPDHPLPYGAKGWASSGPRAAPSVAARRANEDKDADAAAAAEVEAKARKGRKESVLRSVVDRVLGRR